MGVFIPFGGGGGGQSYADKFADEGYTVQWPNLYAEVTQYTTSSFNYPVKLGNNFNMKEAFAGLSSFNQPLVIPENTKTCCRLLLGCTGYNSTIDIKGSKNTSQMFYGFTNMNFNIRIGNNVNCYQMFHSSCGPQYYNQVYIYGNNVDAGGMYYGISAGSYFEGMPVIVNNKTYRSSWMIRDFNRYNGRIIIENGTTDVKYLIYNCENFNQPIVIPEGVTDCSCMMGLCNNFASTVTIPSTATNTYSMFDSCYKFSQQLSIPGNVTDTSRMYYGCNLLDYSGRISDSVINASNMFYGCTNLRGIAKMGNNIENAFYMFYKCERMYAAVTIPNTIKDGRFMFMICNNYNQAVNIPEGVEDCSYMMHSCRIFNNDVTIPSTATNVFGIVCGCPNFDRTITVNNGIKSIAGLYHQAYKLSNRPITIPPSVENCANAFSIYNTSSSFNYPVVIHENIKDISGLYAYSNVNFAAYYTFPNTVEKANAVFYYCNNMNIMNYKIPDGFYNWSGLYSGMNFCSTSYYITVPEAVTDCSCLFMGLTGFSTNQTAYRNTVVQLHNNIKNAYYMFGSGTVLTPNMNGAFIPENVENCAFMYAYANLTYASPHEFPINCNNVKNVRSMFEGSEQLSYFGYIPEGPTTLQGMFQQSTGFSSFTSWLPQSAETATTMFSNSSVQTFYGFAPNDTYRANMNLKYCVDMFYNCQKLQGPRSSTEVDRWALPDSVENCYRMFARSYNFQPIGFKLGNGVKNCYGMFSECHSLNNNFSINIPASVTDCTYMFLSMHYNGTGYAPSNEYITNMSVNFEPRDPSVPLTLDGMFQDSGRLKMFNASTIKLPEGATSCSRMFKDCSYLYYRLNTYIPSTVSSCADMFSGTSLTFTDMFVNVNIESGKPFLTDILNNAYNASQASQRQFTFHVKNNDCAEIIKRQPNIINSTLRIRPGQWQWNSTDGAWWCQAAYNVRIKCDYTPT